MQPKFSIIIPFQKVCDYLLETLDHIGNLKNRSFEVILLPDGQIEAEQVKGYAYPILIFPTGPVSPAIKRDVGAQNCQGEFLAFIDDDAYPKEDWLEKIETHFQRPEVSAVGGPQVTPESDSFWQQVSGASFLPMTNGRAVDRYWAGPQNREVDDWPSVNLIVRKIDFIAINGFDSSYWPGEDSKLCHDLTMVLGKKIIYEPRAIVFHHRRAGFLKHLKQVGNYGLHRGFFAKRFPETSLKLAYLMPSCFFIFVIMGWVGLVAGGVLSIMYWLLWAVYTLAIALAGLSIYLKLSNIPIAFFSLPYIVGTHFWYGFRFLQGFFFTTELKSKLGR